MFSIIHVYVRVLKNPNQSGYNAYRELVSCSNCTDYQSRSMEIRCGQKKMGETGKKYVHMLNSTLVS